MCTCGCSADLRSNSQLSILFNHSEFEERSRRFELSVEGSLFGVVWSRL